MRKPTEAATTKTLPCGVRFYRRFSHAKAPVLPRRLPIPVLGSPVRSRTLPRHHGQLSFEPDPHPYFHFHLRHLRLLGVGKAPVREVCARLVVR